MGVRGGGQCGEESQDCRRRNIPGLALEAGTSALQEHHGRCQTATAARRGGSRSSPSADSSSLVAAKLQTNKQVRTGAGARRGRWLLWVTVQREVAPGRTRDAGSEDGGFHDSTADAEHSTALQSAHSTRAGHQESRRQRQGADGGQRAEGRRGRQERQRAQRAALVDAARGWLPCRCCDTHLLPGTRRFKREQKQPPGTNALCDTYVLAD